MTEDPGKLRSTAGRAGGNRATSLTGSDAGGHGYGSASDRLRQLDDGVKVRVVLPRALAEQIDVLSRERWMTPQEWIRYALDMACVYQGAEWARVENRTPVDWWKDRLERLRAARDERAGV